MSNIVHDYCIMQERGDNKILLVLNNSACIGSELLHLYWQACSVRIAADGAANWLFTENLTPDIVCGDLDSVDLRVAEHFATRTELCRDASQDTNDMEKCLEHLLAKYPSSLLLEVYVLGAFGGRFDHEMANLNCAFPYTSKFSRLVLISQGNTGEVLLANNTLHLLRFPPTTATITCGLLPLQGPCLIAHTKGLKYNVYNQQLRFGGLISTSNQVTNKQEVEILVCNNTPVLFTYTC